MPKPQPKSNHSAAQPLKKFLVSSLVVATFAAYAIHDRLTNSDSLDVVTPPQPTPQTKLSSFSPAPASSSTSNAVPTNPPTAVPNKQQIIAPTLLPTLALPSPAPLVAASLVPPTAVPTTIPSPVPPTDIPTDVPTPVPPTAVPTSLYKDGTFTGEVADAYYGTVQVQVVINNGNIVQVSFLDYPHDRRTSQRINQIAMPYLKTEAIQAQSANVDIISGATLTSEAFMQSLQSALNSARNT